jgi:hypothetical protein
MAHDVFISYSSRDKPAADAACAVLEAAGLRCWIAPRDILPGDDWGGAIIRAISAAQAFVLVFSANANQSPQVRREVERAVNRGLPVIPVRIENVSPTDALEYFINTPHWLDAYTPPLDRHLKYLADVAVHLVRGGEPAQPPAAPPQRPRRSRLPLAAGVLGLAAALAAGYVFLRPRPVPAVAIAPRAPVPAGESVEVAVWNSVSGSNDPRQLQTYLDRYPAGVFADIARDKIAALRKAAAAPPPAAAQPAPVPRAVATAAPGRSVVSPHMGWWRAAGGAGSADYGGGGFVNYRATFTDVNVSIEIGADGKPVGGTGDAQVAETILNTNAQGIAPNKHVFSFRSGDAAGDDIDMDFVGAAGNQPPTKAHLHGHFNGSELQATLTIDRNDASVVVPQVMFSLAIPMTLRQ